TSAIVSFLRTPALEYAFSSRLIEPSSRAFLTFNTRALSVGDTLAPDRIRLTAWSNDSPPPASICFVTASSNEEDGVLAFNLIDTFILRLPTFLIFIVCLVLCKPDLFYQLRHLLFRTLENYSRARCRKYLPNIHNLSLTGYTLAH